MNDTLTLQLNKSILDVMSTMFSMDVEQTDTIKLDDFNLSGARALRACRISFSGNYSGALFLLISKSILMAMTSHFTGDELSSEDQTDGTLKEALNIVGGNALSTWNEQSELGLGIPEMVDISTLSIDEDVHIFEAEGGLIVAYVELGE